MYGKCFLYKKKFKLARILGFICKNDVSFMKFIIFPAENLMSSN